MQILYWTVPFKCTERVFCQNSQANILQFKLTMNCSRPAALLMRGMRGLTGVSEASQISQGLVKHSLNWPLGPAQCKVKIQGESWNLASTAHLAEFIYCTGAPAARPGQCPREISADRPWPEWIDPGNGQCHSVLTAPLGAIVSHTLVSFARVTGPTYGFCLFLYLTNFQTLEIHLRFPWRPLRDPEVKTLEDDKYYFILYTGVSTWACPTFLPCSTECLWHAVLTAAPPSSHLGTIHGAAELDNSHSVLTHFIDTSKQYLDAV